MDAVSAAKLMTEYGLVPSRVSQSLLLGVVEGKWDSVPPELDGALRELRSRYQAIRSTLPKKCPRNLPFYMMVRERYPHFRWELVQDDQGETRVHFENVPKVAKVNPSLLSLLLERVPSNPRRSDALALQMASLPPVVADALRDSFDAMEVARPSVRELEELVQWVGAGLQGAKLTVFTPVCPDYAYEPTGNPKLPYRVTFEGLGDGIGIVAGRALKAVPIFVSALRRCGIHVECVVGSGDFEGFSAENLSRLKLTEEQFMDKLRGSRDKFRDECVLDVAQPMITELCGGRRGWEQLVETARSRLDAGDYGDSDLSARRLDRIVAARKKLYQTWFGLDGSPEVYRRVLNAQGAEYAAMGRIVSERFARPLVLGADHPAMRPFYGLHQRVPVLYLRRVY